MRISTHIRIAYFVFTTRKRVPWWLDIIMMMLANLVIGLPILAIATLIRLIF